MSVTAVITCPKCGQKLGIPIDGGTIHVTCPECKGEWDWPSPRASESHGSAARSTGPSTQRASPYTSNGPPRGHGWFSIPRLRPRQLVRLALIGLGLFIVIRMMGCLLTYTAPSPLPGAEASVPEARRAIWIAPPEQPLPESGHGVFSFDRSIADSMLRIQPRLEQGHVVVKVEDAANAKFVCWMFIRNGESAETRIPAGSYRLKLAYGKQWYGETNLFGPGASYSAIENDIDVTAQRGCTINLHRSPDGKLRETSLRPENF